MNELERLDLLTKQQKRRLNNPDLNCQAGKYFLAKKVCKNKRQAMLQAGYNHLDAPTRIEKTQIYKAIEKRYYTDVLQDKISMAEIADEQVKVIKQDKELGAKNRAIEMALKKIEPDENKSDVTNNVLIVLKG